MIQSHISSLDDAENFLRYAIENRAILTFWHHQLGKFLYFKSSDKDDYHSELSLLRRHLHTGNVKSVSSEKTLHIDCTRLHTTEVTFAEMKCAPYFLLCRDGLMEHADIKPYFFKSENGHDEAVRYILEDTVMEVAKRGAPHCHILPN